MDKRKPKRKHAQTRARANIKNNFAFICFCQFDLQLKRYFQAMSAAQQFS
jgi:hypothetical protein